MLISLTGVMLCGSVGAHPVEGETDSSKSAQVQKVVVYGDGAAQIYVTGSGFSDCYGGAGRVHLGKPWTPAPAAMLTVALKARDRASTVQLDLHKFNNPEPDGNKYCYAWMIRDPS